MNSVHGERGRQPIIVCKHATREREREIRINIAHLMYKLQPIIYNFSSLTCNYSSWDYKIQDTTIALFFFNDCQPWEIKFKILFFKLIQFLLEYPTDQRSCLI